MIFITLSPELVLTPTVSQETPTNLTAAARSYYTAKAADRINEIVEVTSLSIPEGVLEGEDTHIKPEIVLASTDEGAIMEYAYSFFKSEETPHFIVARNIEYDMQNM